MTMASRQKQSQANMLRRNWATDRAYLVYLRKRNRKWPALSMAHSYTGIRQIVSFSPAWQDHIHRDGHVPYVR